MKIIQIMPGYLESYYCENCLRDNSLVRAFRTLGHDVLVVPLYMPTHFDTTQSVRKTEIFMGGINVYLQGKFSFFRKTPRWIDRVFDSPWLLKKVTQKQSMIRAEDLGGLTLSMLRGENGHQRKELTRLVDWLKHHEQPDVICLSNAMLLGLAPSLKKQLNVPLVCLLQDEEPFLDAMPQSHHQLIWDVMIEQARSIDLFIANSEHYAASMKNRLQLKPQQLTTINTALCFDDYPENHDVTKNPTLGYLSRVSEERGLGLLIDAFLQLKKRDDMKNLRLRITGDQMTQSSDWLRSLYRQLESQKCSREVDFIREFDLPNRIDFFRSLSVLCVPKNQGESSGFNILEAQAMSVPVVQPDTSSLPNLLKKTTGGRCFQANDLASLTDELYPLLADSHAAKELGRKGRAHVSQHFNILDKAQEWIRTFEAIPAAEKD